MFNQLALHLVPVIPTPIDQGDAVLRASRHDTKAPSQPVTSANPRIATKKVVLMQAEEAEPRFLPHHHGGRKRFGAKGEVLIAHGCSSVVPDWRSVLPRSLAEAIDDAAAPVQKIRRSDALIRQERPEGGTAMKHRQTSGPGCRRLISLEPQVRKQLQHDQCLHPRCRTMGSLSSRSGSMLLQSSTRKTFRPGAQPSSMA